MFCLTHLKITLQKVLNFLELMLPHGILKIPIEFNKNQRKSMGDRTEGKGSVNWATNGHNSKDKKYLRLADKY